MPVSGKTFFVLLAVIILLNPTVYAESNSDLFTLSIEELMEIKILSASKQPENRNNIPASIVVITSEDIRHFGYNSLKEILKSVPGFYHVDDLIVGGGGFGLRGVWNDTWNRNFVIMINGVKQRDQFYESNILSSINIPTEMIDRIEIIRGPMSVVYGSGAFLGSINIVTNENNGNSQGDYSFNYGSNETYRLSTFLAGNSEDIHYSIGGMFNKTDGINFPYTKFGGSGNWTSKGDFAKRSSGVNMNIQHHNVEAQFSYDESTESDAFLFQPSDNYDQEEKLKAVRLSFSYEVDVKPDITFKSRVTYNHLSIEHNYDTGLFENAWEYQVLTSKNLGFEFNSFINRWEKTEILLGLDYNIAYDIYTIFDLPAFGLSNTIQKVGDTPKMDRAAYTQVHHNFSENIQAVAGVRIERALPYTMIDERNFGLNHVDPDTVYDYEATIMEREYDSDEINAVPRFAVIYSFNPKHTLKLLYGEAIYHPGFYQTRDLVQNPDTPILKSEKIQTFEINYSSIPNSWISSNLSLYHNIMDNLIVRSTGFDNTGTYYSLFNNSGELSTYGIELSFRIKPSERLTISLSGIYQDTKDEMNPEIDVAFAPDYLGYFQASYNFYSDVTFSLSSQYVGRMYSQWDETPVDVTDPNSEVTGRIGDEVDGHFNTNISLLYNNFISEGFYSRLSVQNLFDEDIYYPANTNQPWAKKGTLGNKRTISITIGYSY